MNQISNKLTLSFVLLVFCMMIYTIALMMQENETQALIKELTAKVETFTEKTRQ